MAESNCNGMDTGETSNSNNSHHAAKASQDFDDNLDCFGRAGSQLDEKIEFKNKFGETVSATPVIVDFLRVFQLGQVDESNGVISGVSNRDLLHAVVGLYDISLDDMETETLYATVCSKWARTVVMVQDLKDAIHDATERNVKRQKKKEDKKDKNSEEEEEKTDWESRLNAEEDTLKEEESTPGAYTQVFSDTEDEEEEEEDDENEEEEENYSKGLHSFITKSLERKKKKNACKGIVAKDMIGIEDRLIGCATFEKKFIQHKERVIHLTLISVRPRYRKYRVGKYLLSKCVCPRVVGTHEAVVVHADNSAVDFFKKYGFSDDIILNSKWSELAEAFTNCTLMSFLPAFSGNKLLLTDTPKSKDPDLYEIDQEMKIWQNKSREAYQAQLCCMMKFRNEILQLKDLVCSQNELLNKLITDSDKVRREKLLVEKELTELQLDAARKAASEAASLPPSEAPNDMIQQLENQVAAITTVTAPSPKPSTPAPRPPSTSSEIISRFIEGMEMDRSIQVRYTVSSILKAPSNPALASKFESRLSIMEDPSMETDLYYCGSLEKPSRLKAILANGFTEADFCHGEFGKGLYFSKYPSKAAQFSDLGVLMEVRVGLGNVETVMRYDRTRKSASAGFDSIICPGRLYRPGDQGDVAMLAQEYIVFDVNQVIPSCIIHYSAYPGS